MTRLLVATFLCSLFVQLARPFGQTKECLPELPHLETGHIQLTDQNYAKWQKDNSKLHVLGVSDSSCTQCCQTEAILAGLKEKFDEKVFTGKKGKTIQIGRADIAEQWDFFKEKGIPIDDAPVIFVMHEGRYWRYSLETTRAPDGSYDDVSGILHFINKLQHPLLPLNTEEAIERFLDEQIEVEETTGFFKRETPVLGDHFSRLRHKTRVLVFMFDKEEYASEMKNIREAGRLDAQRLSLRMGLVTDPKLIRMYKARKGNHWFNDEVQLSTIVVQRFDKTTFAMDIFNMDSSGMLIHFMNKKSLMPVTDLDMESGRLVEMVGQQVLVGVTSLNSKSAKIREASKDLVDKTLETIAPTLYRGLTVATVGIELATPMLHQMGVTEAHMPLVYVTDAFTQVPIIYQGELEPDSIRAWAQGILKDAQDAASSSTATPAPKEHRSLPIADKTLVPILKEAKVTILKNSSDLDDLLAFEGDDICIFVFSSAIDDEVNRLVMEQYADVAIEVSRNTKRMKFVAYDLNTLGIHAQLETGHPNAWLSPGTQRHKKLRLFRGEASLEQIAEWLKKHADNKFKMNTKGLDQRIQMLKQAKEMGIGMQGSEGPKKNIMEEVEMELMRRGEL